MVCLIIVVVGVAAITNMPVDLFPPVKIPVVVVATFYSGMPPEQIESDITDSDERFFTLGSNINHIESRSMSGVSLIKIYFQPGTDPTAAVSNISNLAMANLRRLPPGTLPPVVLSFDAANLPVCLITLKGAGMNPNATQGCSAVYGAQSGCECARCLCASALRWNVPTDHGVRRSAEAASVAAWGHGCRAQYQRFEPDPARW